MKQNSLQPLITRLRICTVAFILVIISLILFSFTVNRINDEFFKQLGISKTEGDKKITNSILGGYLDAYGLKNAKNIALGNRTAVAKDLLAYTRQYVSSPAFRNEYLTLKQSNKPVQPETPETPEQMRSSMIKLAKEGVEQSEASLKKADPQFKKIFEDAVTYAKKNLQQAEDPNNKFQLSYKKNYEQLLKTHQETIKFSLERWEKEYPQDHMVFVKQRLQQFLDETKGIEYSATTFSKNGKQYFTDPQYERKSNRWKMAYRAGKEVVEPAREFVQQWLETIR